MKEDQFLAAHVFYGLTNRNDGFDSINIQHFSSKDFQLILKRAKNCNVDILGTECWSQGRLRSVKYMEDYMDNVNWSSEAFSDMCKEQDEFSSLFSATYDVPSEILEKITCINDLVLQSV